MTIYERQGGFPVVRRIVASFYEKVLDSELIAHHFESIDLPRLIDHQTRFISFLMGGPTTRYSDQHLERIHRRFTISLHEFDEMVSLWTETLAEFDFEATDIAFLERELRKREPAIVSAR